MVTSRGFSMIELMFVLTLSAIIGMLAAPITVHWLRGSRQVQMHGELAAAVSRSRALALRNPLARPSGQKAASVKLDGNRLQVLDGNDAVVWTTEVPADVSLKFADGNAFNCVAYDTRGALTETTECKTLLPRMVVAAPSQEDLDAPLL